MGMKNELLEMAERSVPALLLLALVALVFVDEVADAYYYRHVQEQGEIGEGCVSNEVVAACHDGLCCFSADRVLEHCGILPGPVGDQHAGQDEGVVQHLVCGSLEGGWVLVRKPE